MPYCSGVSPICRIRKSGSTAVTISAEASVKKLTMPIATTVPPTRVPTRPVAGRPADAARPSGVSGALRTDVYTNPPGTASRQSYVALAPRTLEPRTRSAPGPPETRRTVVPSLPRVQSH